MKIRQFFLNKNGQTLLSLVLLIGGIVVLVGTTIIVISTSFVNSAYGYQALKAAEGVAVSGVYDALLRLDRNKDLASAGYDLAVGSSTANVSITNPPASSFVTVVSAATVMRRQYKIKAVIYRGSDGLIAVSSWEQTQ
ncbi:MAG: hypothetical protein AAB655_01705 [Patescibacteria group bacterium]